MDEILPQIFDLIRPTFILYSAVLLLIDKTFETKYIVTDMQQFNAKVKLTVA